MRFRVSLPDLLKRSKSKKNENMENFNGTIAVVKDRIDEYVSRMRIGVITAIDDNALFAELTFADLTSARFACSELQVLKNKTELYTLLLSSPEKIPAGDFKLLFQVNMLQDRGDVSSLIEACQLIKSTPSALALATQKLSDRLENKSQSAALNLHSR